MRWGESKRERSICWPDLREPVAVVGMLTEWRGPAVHWPSSGDSWAWQGLVPVNLLQSINISHNIYMILTLMISCIINIILLKIYSQKLISKFERTVTFLKFCNRKRNNFLSFLLTNWSLCNFIALFCINRISLLRIPGFSGLQVSCFT